MADKDKKNEEKKKEEDEKTNKKEPKHVVLSDRDSVSVFSTSKNDNLKGLKMSVSRDLMTQGRRRSTSSSRSEANLTVSHAMREVLSENIMAGPHSALFPVVASPISLDGRPSVMSTVTYERMVLHRLTLDGVDIPVDFDDAIEETGHGRFQYILMALCGFIYSCCSLSTTTLSFVLPAAQEDFQLRTVDMGILNTAPLWGMVIGAYVWGNFADSKGRRFVLLYSLLIDAFAAILSSFMQWYSVFFVCRIFNGFGIIGATGIVFAYLGEFIDSRRRDSYLARLELFWTFGLIAVPVIGFAILPRHWEFGSQETFLYNSWRIFVFACGLPSLTAALLISFMPESPRFLLLQGNLEKTRQVLVRIYVCNTKFKAHDYPVKVLEKSDEASMYFFAHFHGSSVCGKLKKLLHGLVKQHRELFRGRSLFNIFVCSFIDFGLMSVYYTMMLWIPELLHHQEEFLHEHPNSSATLCEVYNESSEDSKGGEIDNSTFLHTILICLTCIPSNILLLFLIRLVSKKALLVGILLGTAVATAALYFMDSIFKVTTMMCIFEMMATLVETILFCCVVEIFPLYTRGTALSLTITIGRIGAVLGNVVFGLMINTHCMVLFFGMSGMLALSGLSALLLPRMRSGH